MTRPLLSFVAIVKNEATNIRKTLESVRPFVDRWTIIDTGSTDGTPAIIKEVMAGVLGRVAEEPFVDYSTTRNWALHLEGLADDAAVFTLMLSGDEALSGGAELRAFLEEHRNTPEGAYSVEMRSTNKRWPYPRILRVDAGWRYKGLVHEIPLPPDQDELRETPPLIPGVVVTHTPSDPERKTQRLREYDLPLLQRVVDDESRELAARTRAMFYLAETHANLAANSAADPGSARLTHQLASMSYYYRYALIVEQLAENDADRRKAADAHFMFYHVADKAGVYTSAEIVTRVQMLVEVYPTVPGLWFLLVDHLSRIEPAQALVFSEKAAEVARRAKVEQDVVDDRFEWLALHLGAWCAKQLGRVDKAKKLAAQALAAGAPRDKVEGLL